MTPNFPKLVFDSIPKLSQTRVRSWTGFWPSDAGKDLRDLYWKIIGEPETDPMDYRGHFTTRLGSWTEAGLTKDWFSKLGMFGYHLYDAQVAVGEFTPIPWQGYIDFIFTRIEEGKPKFYVKELKTTWGRGATFMFQNLQPKPDHTLQLGLYLRDLYNKGKKIEEGALTYVLVCDDPNIRGVFLEFAAKYNPKEETIDFFEIRLPNEIRPFNYSASIKQVFEDWKKVWNYADKKELPPATHLYKYPITQDYVESLKDYQILQALEGDKIHGDWQIEYSNYKKKHLELTKIKPFYTMDEVKMFEEEYKKRHPKTRKFK